MEKKTNNLLGWYFRNFRLSELSAKIGKDKLAKSDANHGEWWWDGVSWGNAKKECRKSEAVKRGWNLTGHSISGGSSSFRNGREGVSKQVGGERRKKKKGMKEMFENIFRNCDGYFCPFSLGHGGAGMKLWPQYLRKLVKRQWYLLSGGQNRKRKRFECARTTPTISCWWYRGA